MEKPLSGAVFTVYLALIILSLLSIFCVPIPFFVFLSLSITVAIIGIMNGK